MTGDWPSILGAVLGVGLPGLGAAVAWGRLLSRMDTQDATLARLERKLDELAEGNVRELELRVAGLVAELGNPGKLAQ